VFEERGDVARIELAGMLRHRCRQVQRRRDGDGVPDDGLPGDGELAVAARLTREVDDHTARTHSADCFGGDQSRCRAARNERRGDHRIEARDRFGEPPLLLGLFLAGQRAGIAAVARGLDTEFQPLGTQRAHLLGDFGPDVEPGGAGAKPFGGGERLKPGDPHTQDQYRGRFHRPGGRSEHGKEAH
jgi:hypothetical protein